MKRFIILLTGICVCAVVFQSCRKNRGVENKELVNAIKGSWELRQRSGGMMAGANQHLPGNGNLLKFTSDGYEMYENGQLKKSGSYTVVEDGTVSKSVCLEYPGDKFRNRIVYDNNFNGDKIFLQLSDSASHQNVRLSFVSGCYAIDAGSNSEYEKQ